MVKKENQIPTNDKIQMQSLNKNGENTLFKYKNDFWALWLYWIKKIVDLSPKGIRNKLKLNNPIYETTAAYGHFGRKPTNNGEFTWEKTDKVNLFKL